MSTYHLDLLDIIRAFSEGKIDIREFRVKKTELDKKKEELEKEKEQQMLYNGEKPYSTNAEELQKVLETKDDNALIDHLANGTPTPNTIEEPIYVQEKKDYTDQTPSYETKKGQETQPRKRKRRIVPREEGPLDSNHTRDGKKDSSTQQEEVEVWYYGK